MYRGPPTRGERADRSARRAVQREVPDPHGAAVAEPAGAGAGGETEQKGPAGGVSSIREVEQRGAVLCGGAGGGGDGRAVHGADGSSARGGPSGGRAPEPGRQATVGPGHDVYSAGGEQEVFPQLLRLHRQGCCRVLRGLCERRGVPARRTAHAHPPGSGGPRRRGGAGAERSGAVLLGGAARGRPTGSVWEGGGAGWDYGCGAAAGCFGAGCRVPEVVVPRHAEQGGPCPARPDSRGSPACSERMCGHAGQAQRESLEHGDDGG
mmetsp:Transcript_79530/g.212617  ORF Transcript_79530/g.212617 Transcript_79530/m.212617 type:complete len:265 (-) Transcript_79530:36-830(-)